MAQKNSKNREAKCAYSRTGRTPHCKVAHEKVKRGEPIDDITMWKSTRDPKNKSFRTEDGSAERAAMRRLNDLPQEEQNDFKLRNKIFRDVVGQGGHGHSLLKGRGIKTTYARENAILKALSNENNQLNKDVEDREIRHKEELLKMKEDTTNELYRILESVGINASRQTVGTLDSDDFRIDK